MCGIAGFVNCGDENRLRKSTESIIHRGPDDMGVFWFSDQNTGLGHTRLSILDLSPLGHQPMFNDSKDLCIVFNGEVYNFQELRSELEALGVKFISHTDTEVILKAYEKWGEKCLQRFNGMFAFAIWDSREKKLFCARDRLGVKPFYYYDDGKGGLIFSSEIKAIIASGLYTKEIDPEALRLYLSLNYIPAPKTLFKGINKLPPAHYFTYHNKRFTMNRYWAAPYGETMADKGVEVHAQEFKEIFSDAVRLRMISDVPVGAFLSGGIDSSAVVYEMSRLTKHPVKTFSVGFEEGGKHYDELRFAKMVSDHCHTDHTVVMCDAKEALRELPRLIYHLDEPICDNLIYPAFKLSKLTRNAAVPVVLTGEGADEFLHGYRYYSVLNQYSDRFESLPAFLRQQIRNWLKKSNAVEVPRTRILQALLENSWWDKVLSWNTMLQPYEIDKLLLKKSSFSPSEYLKTYLPVLQSSELYCSFFEHRFRLPDYILTKMDKMSMASAVECRMPFLDYRLVEYMVKLPLKYKNPPGQTKYLFRYVYKDALPKEIVNRPKHPFQSPIKFWLGDIAHQYLDNSFLVRDGIISGEVLKGYMVFRDGLPVFSLKLWTLSMLEIWYRIYFCKETNEYNQIIP